MSADLTKVNANTRHAFSHPVATLSLSQQVDFAVGRSFFKNPWVIAPSTTTARDGLGPLYNANACQNCHVGNGRGHPPEESDDTAVSMLVRLSVPVRSTAEQERLAREGVIVEPRYGGQLQDFAIPGFKAEGRIELHYSELETVFADGETLTLRKPTLTISDLAYGDLDTEVMTSARIATPMIGLGLLAAIDPEDILAHADPEDSDKDGISGRHNQVWDIEQNDARLGRFGWKAGQPSLKQQNAAAFQADLGIDSTLIADTNCTSAQANCLRAAKGGQPELQDNILESVTYYTENLAVPRRRHIDHPQVKQGEELFDQARCNRCHVSDYTTRISPHAWLNQQRIAPYSDLLLHDMGDGLADHRPEFRATGREWRTAPLWGIGLTEAVGGRAYFLHDGRARNLMEAIAWHGGEAQASRDAVLAMSKSQRDALLRFLQSL